jgi:phage gpG-like protein
VAAAAQTRLVGLARFRATVKAAGADMADMKDANQRAAAIVASEGSSRAPKASGALAGSLVPARTLARARVSSSLAYAGVIHWGWPARGIPARPFLTEAATSTQPQWLAAYEHDLQRIADSVKGA